MDRSTSVRRRGASVAPLAGALMLLLLIVRPAFGQGSRSDYERSREMPGRLRGKVVNESLREVWLSGDTLVFRRHTAPDRWEFVKVNAGTGDIGPAFDHEAVSGALGAALGRDLDPARMPLERFAIDGDRLLVLIENEARVFRVAPGDGDDVEEVPIEDAPAFRLEPTRRRRSRDAGGETQVLFVNASAGPVDVIWLDREGGRRHYHTIAPGGRERQHTFAGHVWQIERKEGGDVLGVYAARNGFGVILIGDEPVALTPTPDEAPPEPRPRAARCPTAAGARLVREHNVFLRDRETGEEHQLSTDGTAEDAYVERWSWSPDSRRLAVVRVEPAQEHTIHFVETAPRDQVQPRLHAVNYLKPGDRIEHPRPQLLDVAKMEKIPVDEALFDTPWTITRFMWRPDGSELMFLYNQRGHQVLRVIGVDAETGRTRAIIDEKSATFVDYANKLFLHHVEATGELIWMSERDGWNHLYLVDIASGAVQHRITSGSWVVRAVDGVDDTAREIRFRAVGVFPDQDPYHEHHGRVRFDGSGLTWLTRGDGTHTLRASPDGAYYVDTFSRVDLPPVHELRRAADGSLVCELARADGSALLDTGWRMPERFVAKGRDGATDIWGVIFRPSSFDPARTYPVIENIYAGPHSAFVPKSFRAWHGSSAMAELGFIVVRIDGMGTNWRSKAFHDVCWKNLGDSGFPDRIAWMRAAARERPYLDLDRVGIYGGSAGGQSALRAVLAHGDFYRAAVADCGCHDNRMDKIWWNELWMSWPIGPHYDEQSNVTNAHRLEGDLLLIVGELDRNVDPASTMQVADALIRADKDFELLIMTGTGHGAAETPYGRRRRQDFFVRHLLGVEPRWEDRP